MKNTHIRRIVFPGILLIAGILALQTYRLAEAFQEQQLDFEHDVRASLGRVAEQTAKYADATVPTVDLVNQIEPDYYVVNVNSEIDQNVLEYYLRSEFLHGSLRTDFDYGIYNCATDSIVNRRYVSVSAPEDAQESKGRFSRWKGSNYYFGVRFPGRQAYIVNRLSVWVSSSFILLIICGFFAYSLIVILQQKRYSEIQKDFINNMTHEFKTPISTIAIAAKVLSDPNIIQQPERLSNYAGIIMHENERLRQQTEKVLQSAEFEKKKPVLTPEKIDLQQLVKTTAKGFILKYGQNENALRTDIEAGEFLISADRVHLTNILYNLLDNAFKYAGKAETEVCLSLKKGTKRHKNCIRLTVSDNGIGISKKHKKLVFEKFYRVPTGNLHNVKGFGLGLSYVRSVIEMHNWAFELESEPEKGTDFHIYIPRIKN